MSEATTPVPVTDLKPGDVILVNAIIGNSPKRATVTRPPSQPFTDMYGRELVTVWLQQGIKPYSHLLNEGARCFLATGTARRVRAEAQTATYEQAMDRMEAARRGLQHARREAKRIVREAESEWEAADANLSRFEESPGIPLR